MSKFVTEPVERDRILFDALTQKKLELTIMPTEKCNFRCVYCYEDFAIGRMKRPTIEGIKNLIKDRISSLDYLRLWWFGGEPLLAYNVMVDVMEFVKKLREGRDLKFHSSATTNGYLLTEERFTALSSLDLQNYQISIDGDQDEHNKTRRRADGAGTFDTIWTNLKTYNRLRESGIIPTGDILLRLHIHPENIHSMLDFCRRIKQELSSNFFRLYVKEIGHYGSENDKNFNVIDHGSMEYERAKRRILDVAGSFKEELTNPTYVCYATKANSFVLRADGRVGKCTTALNIPSNTVGNLNEDGTILFDQEKLKKWIRPLETLDKVELGCPLSQISK